MSSIAENIDKINSEIAGALEDSGRSAGEARLVAVSKTFPASKILEAAAAGQRLFGENYVQDAVDKIPQVKEQFPAAKFHFIGHLQRNKAKLVVEHFDLLETVDSLRLAEALINECEKQNSSLDVLVQVNISSEGTKWGVSGTELSDLVDLLLSSKYLNLKGLMSIGSFSEDSEPEFIQMAKLLKMERERTGEALPELSMGMSNDFKKAIKHGATLVRIGTKIFGERVR